MKAFPVVSLLSVFLLLLATVPGAAEKLEIDRESDGIHIIQKRTPKKLPSPEATPEGQADADQEEQAPPPVAEDAPKKDETQKKQVPLEENPEYIKALNKLTDRYNRSMENLQNERLRLSNQYNQRAGDLRQRVLSTEQAMALAEQNYERDRFEEFQQRRLTLLRRLQTLESNWQDTRNELRRREQKLKQEYETAKQELKQRYQDQKED